MMASCSSFGPPGGDFVIDASSAVRGWTDAPDALGGCARPSAARLAFRCPSARRVAHQQSGAPEHRELPGARHGKAKRGDRCRRRGRRHSLSGLRCWPGEPRARSHRSGASRRLGHGDADGSSLRGSPSQAPRFTFGVSGTHLDSNITAVFTTDETGSTNTEPQNNIATPVEVPQAATAPTPIEFFTRLRAPASATSPSLHQSRWSPPATPTRATTPRP